MKYLLAGLAGVEMDESANAEERAGTSGAFDVVNEAAAVGEVTTAVPLLLLTSQGLGGEGILLSVKKK